MNIKKVIERERDLILIARHRMKVLKIIFETIIFVICEVCMLISCISFRILCVMMTQIIMSKLEQIELAKIAT